MEISKKTKREMKIAGIGALLGLVLGIYLAHPTRKPSGLERMRAEVKQQNEDTDKWLDTLDRELAEEESPGD